MMDVVYQIYIVFTYDVTCLYIIKEIRKIIMIIINRKHTMF